MIFVIGSGPAGVSAATALLARGEAVTLIDVGLTLDQTREEKLSQAKVDQRVARSLRHSLNSKNPIKLSYGSDFPYAETTDYFSCMMDNNIHCMPSFARGGLSNVWGAFVDRYSQEAFHDWPISLESLALFYEKIYAMLHATDQCHSSHQAIQLLSQWKKNQGALAQETMSFGKPLLAVRFNDATSSCNYCGLCQHGCPFELIYNSAHTLSHLLQHSNFTYIKNAVVTDIHELPDSVIISAVDRSSKERSAFAGKRVFVACGPIISTALVMKALKQERAAFLDSTHVMIPCLMLKGVDGVTKEKLHTLCQLFLKIKHPEVASKEVHLQIYTYMDHYEEKFKNMFKLFYPLLSPLLKKVLNRLIVIQVQFDSSDSHQFEMHLNHASSIRLVSLMNAKVKNNIKALAKFLKRNRRSLGFVPMEFMMRQSKITKSFHYGGSMPMREKPQGLETDRWGRPASLQRVHVVDAAVFPSIPAGSITPTIMANAYRIASECFL